MSGYRNILFEQEGPIAVLTVNRPEKRNALDQITWEEIRRVIDQVGRSDEIQVLIVTGAGEKAFVAGADLHFLRQRSALETYAGLTQKTLTELEALPQVVIAAVNGYALGGGCEVALACDFRIASENAKFGQPEITLGFMPGAGGTQRLPRLVGRAMGMELILTGEIIDAQEALRIGLVNRVTPPAELMPTVRRIAQRICANAPLAVRFAKRVIDAGLSTDMRTGLELERLAQTVLFGTEDRIEGLTAFLEKRPPRYIGR